MRNLQQDYLFEQPDLSAFYTYPIQSLDFGQIIRNRTDFPPEKRNVLAAYLEGEYAHISADSPVHAQLNSLRSPNTFTVTTGHQLGLFGGPMFTFYKVISTLKLCSLLRKHYPDFQFVPIFWIHTEDHDFAEVNHYYKSFFERQTYTATFGTAVGRHILTDEIDGLIPQDFPADLKAAYQAGKSWKQGFFTFMHSLFGQYGLVQLDADAPALKALFVPAMEQEIKGSFSARAVLRTQELLREKGYNPQLYPREINLFYLDGQGRNRIEKNTDGSFQVHQRELNFSQTDLLALVRNQPALFSPNVCLRPLYQESILPNLVYFGGWAEVAYWLELKGVFEAAAVPFPAVLPRFSATLWRPEEADKWENLLHLHKKDLSQPDGDLRKRILTQLWNPMQWEMHKEMVLQKMRMMQHYIDGQTPNLPHAVEGFGRRLEAFMHRTEKKLFRQLELKHKDVFDVFGNVRNRVQPQGLVQERVLNLSAFPDYDPHWLVAQLTEACDPLDYGHRHILLAGE